MTPDPTTLLTSVGMIAQFIMLWLGYELHKGRRAVERQNQTLEALLERSKV